MNGVLVIVVLTLIRVIIPFGIVLLIGSLVEHRRLAA